METGNSRNARVSQRVTGDASFENGKREEREGGERKPRRRVRGFIKETPESLPAVVRNPETVKKIAYPLSPPWRMCTVVANFNADAV